MLTSSDLYILFDKAGLSLSEKNKTKLLLLINEVLFARYGDLEKSHELIFDLCSLRSTKSNQQLSLFRDRAKEIFEQKREFNEKQPKDSSN